MKRKYLLIIFLLLITNKWISAQCLTLSSAVGTNNQSVCINSPITTITYTNPANIGVTGATFTGLPQGVFGFWVNNVAIIYGTPSVSEIFNYTVTLTGGICGGVSASGTITVPAINAVATPFSQTICSGATIDPIALMSNVAGTTYNWKRNNGGLDTGSVRGIDNLGNGEIISGALTNTTNSPVAVTFTITPTANGCGGAPITAIVLVNPTPVVNQPANQLVCNNSFTESLNFTGPVVGTNFSWTNNNTSINLVASGGGNIAYFNAINNSNVPVTAIITVTPSTGGGFAYISNSVTNNVSVINTANNAVVATVSVGPNPKGVSVSPDGSRVYIANHFSNTVSVINTATKNVIANVTVGSNPYGLAVSSDGSRVFVAHPYSNYISVINTATNTMIATVSVGALPYGLAVSPNGKLYVASEGPDSVYVINTATYLVEDMLKVGSDPHGVSVSPDGSLVYVTNSSSNNVSVINTATNTVDATVGVQQYPFGVAVSPNGSRVYVANSNSNTVSVIDRATNTVVATVAVGNGSHGISVSPDGTQVYVTNYDDNNVSVINTATNTVVNTVAVGINPTALGNFISGGLGCIGTPKTFTITVKPSPEMSQPSDQVVCDSVVTSPVNFTGSLAGTIFNWTNSKPNIGLAASGSGNIASFRATNTSDTVVTATVTVTPNVGGFAYISNYNANNVSVINTATNTVVATVSVGPNPEGVSISPDGSRVYVSNHGSNTVSVINTATNTVVATVPLGSSPYGLAVSSDGSRVYVAHPNSNNISLINTDNNTVIATVNVGTLPYGLAVSSNGNKLYVANEGTDNVSVINTVTNLVEATVAVGSDPHGLSVSPDGSRVYVTNSSSNNVSVINTVNNTIIASVNVESYPFGVAVSPDGNRVYVVNSNSNTVSVINTATNTIVATVSVGNGPHGISVSTDGTRVYVTNYDDNNVSIINTATNSVVNTVAVGNNPSAFGNFITGPSCVGTAKTFTYIVNPKPSVQATPLSQTICSGKTITTIILTGAVNGTTFNWKRDKGYLNGGIVSGIDSSGTGNISGALTNITNAPHTVTFTITPTVNNCQGRSITATILVNPTPKVNPVTPLVVCNQEMTIEVIVDGPVAQTTFSWTNNNIGIGLSPNGSGNVPRFRAINNDTTLAIATITVTPSINGCIGDTSNFNITVKPSPPKPNFKSMTFIPDFDELKLCVGSNNINFNISSPANGVSYLWSSDLLPVSSIKDRNDPNTVISFPSAGDYKIYAIASDNSNNCTATVTQKVKVESLTPGIDERKIFLKQPGNLLIYPDNSMNKSIGYQWGYDSLIRTTTTDTTYSAPIPIAGQVYQFFIPDKRFLNSNGLLDEVKRAFWVQLQKDSCKSRVYYNGPYARRTASSPAEINTVQLKVFPNPNNGIFHIALTGNIYGYMRAVIYNALGQVLYTSAFTKRTPEIYQQFNTGSLPAGLYFLEIKSSDLKKVQTRFIVKH